MDDDVHTHVLYRHMDNIYAVELSDRSDDMNMTPWPFKTHFVYTFEPSRSPH